MVTKQETLVLNTINRYNKPVKTKHLAPRLNLDRPSLVAILNRLAKKKLIKWYAPKKDERNYFGWVKIDFKWETI